jgi:hypothetical protein
MPMQSSTTYVCELFNDPDQLMILKSLQMKQKKDSKIAKKMAKDLNKDENKSSGRSPGEIFVDDFDFVV